MSLTLINSISLHKNTSKQKTNNTNIPLYLLRDYETIVIQEIVM